MLPDVWCVLLSSSDHIPGKLDASKHKSIWSSVAKHGQTQSALE